MKVAYIPLLKVQRDLQGFPRGPNRFREYLNTIAGPDGKRLQLPSLIAMNPMGKDHVTALLDQFLAMDADGIAARAVATAATELAAEPGDYNVALVVADDLMGGWTNRYANEFTHRFPPGGVVPGEPKLPRWLTGFWITGLLWSSDPPSDRAVREAILTAIHRTAYLRRHGCRQTLRERMAQEGAVMAAAGCRGPVLEAEDIEYTRVVITPVLDTTDMRTAIEYLFGDAAGATLGFTPRGLSPWAGLALALRDARAGAPG
jgi:hypothetical protein